MIWGGTRNSFNFLSWSGPIGVMLLFTLLWNSVWSILVRAYPTIIELVGRKLFLYWTTLIPLSLGSLPIRTAQETSYVSAWNKGGEGTVFFFARSPEAPRTTIVTSFFNSIELSRYQFRNFLGASYGPWGWWSISSFENDMSQRNNMQWNESRWMAIRNILLKKSRK